MGSLCCKPKKQNRNAYKKLEPYQSNDQLVEHVLSRSEAQQLIEQGAFCNYCHDDELADSDVYDEWQEKHLCASKVLQAPEGIYGSICACDPKKSLRHLACLRRELNVLAEDSKRRRTCGFCNEPWAVIKTIRPAVALELREERDDALPAWRWEDISAGNYWVRVQAGPSVASEPEDVDSDLPDAYTRVQIEIFSHSATLVNAKKQFATRWWARKFNALGTGKRLKWSTVRSIIEDLEQTSDLS